VHYIYLVLTLKSKRAAWDNAPGIYIAHVDKQQKFSPLRSGRINGIIPHRKLVGEFTFTTWPRVL
jgi:hypothetical protein